MGNTKNKFSFTNHRNSNTITEDTFFKWTSGNMCRTSYHDMSKKVSKYNEKLITSYDVGRISREKKYGNPKVPRLHSKLESKLITPKKIY